MSVMQKKKAPHTWIRTSTSKTSYRACRYFPPPLATDRITTFLPEGKIGSWCACRDGLPSSTQRAGAVVFFESWHMQRICTEGRQKDDGPGLRYALSASWRVGIGGRSLVFLACFEPTRVMTGTESSGFGCAIAWRRRRRRA